MILFVLKVLPGTKQLFLSINHSITEFVSLMNILGKRICHFHARADARRRKARFPWRMSRILFAAKHCWTALRMSRPLFVGSYLQVTKWALGQWKERKINLSAENKIIYYQTLLAVFASESRFTIAPITGSLKVNTGSAIFAWLLVTLVHI